MSAGGQDKAAYRAAGPGKMGFKKGAYGSAKGVRAKAANLSDAQLKRAGALKASKKAAIDYTKTSRVLGSGVTRGPGGKLLTGKVTLANGKTAVYKAGKRVVNKPVSVTKPKSPPPKTGSYQTGSGTTSTAGARARSAAQGKIYADRNRPSFAKQEAAVAKALIDWKKAKDDGTKAYAKRQYDQAVSVLNSIKDYFR
jgi:hypothetical protein